MKKILLIGVAATLLGACVPQQNYNRGYDNNGYSDFNPAINKQGIGALLGATGGAILGSNVGKGKGNIAAIAIGTLIGAGMGSSIGSSLDAVDAKYHKNATISALEHNQAGRELPWRNPDNGHSGKIIPSEYYKTRDGKYCREFTQVINVGGRTAEAVGKACRQPDGTWNIVN